MKNIGQKIMEKGANNMKTYDPRKCGGPVVKTGPTAGQNRSRNDNGRWRAKRSDAGKSRKTNLA